MVFKVTRVRACLLEKHGSAAVGDSLLKARHIAELVEETARMTVVGLIIDSARGDHVGRRLS